MSIKYVSTRGEKAVTVDGAIVNGLAADGGLYVPTELPHYDLTRFNTEDLVQCAAVLLAPFFTDSQIRVNEDFCREVFSFLLPLTPLQAESYLLELFHGPTLSFKDFGARFFAQCLPQLIDKPTTILVATSGDTGSAVASAFHGKKGIKAVILFPYGQISERQQAQMTCWGDNIQAVAVQGSFDQCQQLVKQIFRQPPAGIAITTANSINIARLLPQVLFYAYSSMRLSKQHGAPANFIVPSGNLGNVTACYWAKQMGFPIADILIATNANTVLSDFLDSGSYHAQPTRATLANAMDVGDPSNLERLLSLFPDFSQLKQSLNVQSVSDEEIKIAIKKCYQQTKQIICPHTATAYWRWLHADKNKLWILAATAHPVKFAATIEPLIQQPIPIPPVLAEQMQQGYDFSIINPSFNELVTLVTS